MYIYIHTQPTMNGHITGQYIYIYVNTPVRKFTSCWEKKLLLQTSKASPVGRESDCLNPHKYMFHIVSWSNYMG